MTMQEQFDKITKRVVRHARFLKKAGMGPGEVANKAWKFWDHQMNEMESKVGVYGHRDFIHEKMREREHLQNMIKEIVR